MSKTKVKKRVETALSESDLSGAVDALKSGLNRDPYWAEGHKLLGDIYLIGLDHPVYALVEYRKLKRVKDELEELDKLRLAWAYHCRSFDDKARAVLTEINCGDLPEELEVIDTEIKPIQKTEELRSEVNESVEQDSEEYFQKYFRKGNEFLNAGNFYRAQQAYENALEHEASSRARLNLARCFVERTKFPKAVRELKSLLDDEHVHEEARKLLTSVYRRLGLPVSSLKSELDGFGAEPSRDSGEARRAESG